MAPEAIFTANCAVQPAAPSNAFNFFRDSVSTRHEHLPYVCDLVMAMLQSFQFPLSTRTDFDIVRALLSDDHERRVNSQDL
jgi:hypothetical protein